MSIVSIKNSLNSGELAPSLYGRTNLEKWESGLSTCRNFVIDYRGGAQSRAGLAYVGTSKQPYGDGPPRLIPFQFNIDQGYALEFGDKYMRVVYRGAYVCEQTVSAGVDPNFGGIEAYIGAGTPVGYNIFGDNLKVDRDVNYVVSLNGGTSSGSDGLRNFARNTVGNEIAQATLADLGIGGCSEQLGSVLHPNGNIYFIQGATNSAALVIAKASDLSYVGNFGTPGSHLGSDSTHMSLSFQMIPVVASGHNRLVSIGISSAFGDSEVSLWDCTSNSLSFIGKDQPVEPHGGACEGSRGDGKYYVLGNVNYGGGGTTPFTLYSADSNIGAALTPIVSISPTDIDPTWTTILGVTGPGYDNADGNLLCLVATGDLVTNQNYLIKVDSSTGSIIWATPVTQPTVTQVVLSRCYLDGTLQYFQKSINSVVTVDLSDGSLTTTAWNNGFGGGSQWFDNALGQIFMNSGYGQSTGPIPTYLGVYLSSHGNVVPQFRWLTMYSLQNLPGPDIPNPGVPITSITQDSPGVVTFDFGINDPYQIGDWIYFTDVEGMTNWDGLTWIVATNPAPNQYTFTDLFGAEVDTNTWYVYTGGGLGQKIFTLDTPYAIEDLPYIKYAQSADVMTLCCVNPTTGTEYPPYSLSRLGQADWTLVQDTFGSSIAAPTNVVATAQSSTTVTTWYAYVVTSVDSKTGEESVASTIAYVQNNDISVYLGSNTIAWDGVQGAGSYNVYAAPASYGLVVPAGSVFGFIGTSLGTGFTDNNLTPDFTIVPPTHFDPFAIGAITDVIATNGGDGNYSAQTIGYSINTSTGTGFSGYPVVVNGLFQGFVVLNQGQNYAIGDSISFTDSGGGVAKGNYHVTSQPSDGDTLSLNGGTVEFKNPGSVEHPNFQIAIGTTIEFTLRAVSDFFTGLVNATNLNVASYTYDVDHLYIVYNTPGATGNTYVLGGAPSGWTRTASTLTGGGVAGTGAAATLTIGETSGTFPSVPAYFQQRRVYANSQNDPDTYWMSQVGNYTNMDTSIPTMEANSITGTPWAQQVNGIGWLIPMPGGLVTFTGKQAWQVSGGSQAAITPSDQTAIAQAFNGASNLVPPQPINYDILFVQAKGSAVRDLSYNFFTNIYTGTDLTVLSNHLFLYNSILQWCWCEEPYKTMWAVRNDGILLCLTYVKEQDVFAWSRHDTNGLFVSVCSVTEPPVDALYTVVQRYINGGWRYYTERMSNRLWNNVEASFCVDSGVSYPVPNEVTGLAYVLTLPFQDQIDNTPIVIFPEATLNVSAATGTGVTFTVTDESVDIFSADNIGNVIRTGGGKATITTFVSSTEVLGDITEPITNVLYDNSNNFPVPQASGNWSLSIPTTTVTNLNHLEGQTVAILADGSVVDNQVVTNGKIVLDQEASLVTIGLPYVCQAQTLYLEHQDNTGTAQNRRKNIAAVGLRVEASRGLSIGADQPDQSTQQNYAPTVWTNMTEIKERTNQVNAGVAVPLFTGDYYQSITAGWRVTGQVAVQQTYPLPATIIAIISYWNLGDNKV